MPVCTAAALQRYELALSSRARAVPSSSILEAVASGRPSPPGSRASRSAFGRRMTSASWTRARGSRRGARRRSEGVCDGRSGRRRQPKRRVGASPFGRSRRGGSRARRVPTRSRGRPSDSGPVCIRAQTPARARLSPCLGLLDSISHVFRVEIPLIRLECVAHALGRARLHAPASPHPARGPMTGACLTHLQGHTPRLYAF